MNSKILFLYLTPGLKGPSGGNKRTMSSSHPFFWSPEKHSVKTLVLQGVCGKPGPKQMVFPYKMSYRILYTPYSWIRQYHLEGSPLFTQSLVWLFKRWSVEVGGNSPFYSVSQKRELHALACRNPLRYQIVTPRAGQGVSEQGSGLWTHCTNALRQWVFLLQPPPPPLPPNKGERPWTSTLLNRQQSLPSWSTFTPSISANPVHIFNRVHKQSYANAQKTSPWSFLSLMQRRELLHPGQNLVTYCLWIAPSQLQEIGE